MTKTLGGTFLAMLLLVGAAWAIAIPLGASNGVLGTVALLVAIVPLIPRSKYYGPEYRDDPDVDSLRPWPRRSR